MEFCKLGICLMYYGVVSAAKKFLKTHNGKNKQEIHSLEVGPQPCTICRVKAKEQVISIKSHGMFFSTTNKTGKIHSFAQKLWLVTQR